MRNNHRKEAKEFYDGEKQVDHVVGNTK